MQDRESTQSARVARRQRHAVDTRPARAPPHLARARAAVLNIPQQRAVLAPGAAAPAAEVSDERDMARRGQQMRSAAREYSPHISASLESIINSSTALSGLPSSSPTTPPPHAAVILLFIPVASTCTFSRRCKYWRVRAAAACACSKPHHDGITANLGQRRIQRATTESTEQVGGGGGAAAPAPSQRIAIL